jgi:hypothetical protein
VLRLVPGVWFCLDQAHSMPGPTYPIRGSHTSPMSDKARPTPAELAGELIAADRPSKPREQEPVPSRLLFSPTALLLYPFLRRNRKTLMPLVLAAMALLVLLAALT